MSLTSYETNRRRSSTQEMLSRLQIMDPAYLSSHCAAEIGSTTSSNNLLATPSSLEKNSLAQFRKFSSTLKLLHPSFHPHKFSTSFVRFPSLWTWPYPVAVKTVAPTDPRPQTLPLHPR